MTNARQYSVRVKVNKKRRPRGIAARVIGAKNMIGDSRPVMTSEDFGYMPGLGACILVGNGAEGIGGCSLHNPRYDLNDDILLIGAGFRVELVQPCLAV